MKHSFSTLKRMIATPAHLFPTGLQFRVAPEPGNTKVIAPTRLLNVKGLDPGNTGAIPGSTQMSIQDSQVARPSSIKRYAAKTAAVLTAIALVAAMTVPAIGTAGSRASADHAPLEAIFGSVVAVQVPDSITVATDSGVITVVVPSNDVFTGDITAVEDITEGDRLVGSIHVAEDGTTTADRILIVPDLTKSVTRHILGVVLEVQDGAIVVQDRDGNTITVDVPEGIEIPEEGTVVTAVAQLDRATGRLEAQAFDLVEDAVQRIQDAKDRVTDSDLKDELEERLERARDQHLSALERARQGLERAQEAVSAAIAERDEAQRRLVEVQARFDDLRQRYVQEASDRNERLPELLTEGTLNYDEIEWAEPNGTFSLVPRINDADDGVMHTFAWNDETLAIIPVELRETDPSSPAITATIARSVALPLNDVKSLIPSGSQVIVQYDPNTEPAVSTLITVLPPTLPEAIEDALERERLRSISGFITLVEDTPELDDTVGVVVVANRQHDLRVAAKVTANTEIVVDGEPARFGDLAAGMSVEVEFDSASADAESDDTATLTGRLNALRIRASTQVDDEVHVAGQIAGLDPETRTVGIITRDGDIVRAQVIDDAVIVKDGVQSRFGALEVGDLVLDATRFNRETLVLTRLAVQSPKAVEVSGAVSGIDRNPDRLAINTANGRALVVFVIDATVIRTEVGTTVRFSELSVGDRVLKGEAQPIQRDGNTVLVGTELVVGDSNIAAARGVVSRVAADSGQLSITTNLSNTVAGTDLINLSVADNNRSVITKNDVRIRTLAPIQPGDIVESVSYDASTGTIIKMSVVSANLQRIRGFVSTVTDSGVTILTSSGLTVGLAVTDETVMTLNGRRIASLDPVDRGDIVVEAVYIARSGNTVSGLALRITLISPLPAPGETLAPGDADGNETATAAVETTVSGVIEEISDDEWLIGDRSFKITDNTRFFGERPQVGLVAKATLVLDSDGDFVATAISVAGRPDTNPTTRPVEIQPVEPGDTPDLVRILGKVQSLERGRDGNLAVVVLDGVKLALLADTVVVGEPRVGTNALAVVRRTPGGAVVAASIIFVDSNNTGGNTDSQAGSNVDSNDRDETNSNTPGTLGPASPPEPKPAEDHDDPMGVSPSFDDNSAPNADAGDGTVGASDSDAPNLETRTITVEQISGRVVVSGGDTYLLKTAQAISLRTGDEIQVRVRSVDRDKIETALSIIDRLAVVLNPLYQETATAGDSPVYVAE